MALTKVSVHHWHYDDGWYTYPGVLVKKGKPEREYREEVKGWHCWVYCDDDYDFIDWMKDNMNGEYDATQRFNSGDPMITVVIKDEQDADFFKLTWM